MRVLSLAATAIGLSVSMNSLCYSQSMDLDGYCRSRGYAGVSNLDNTGYGWRCQPGNASIDAFDLCKKQYGQGYQPSLKTPPPGGPNDWSCVLLPGQAQQAQPQPQLPAASPGTLEAGASFSLHAGDNWWSLPRSTKWEGTPPMPVTITDDLKIGRRAFSNQFHFSKAKADDPVIRTGDAVQIGSSCEGSLRIDVGRNRVADASPSTDFIIRKVAGGQEPAIKYGEPFVLGNGGKWLVADKAGYVTLTSDLAKATPFTAERKLTSLVGFRGAIIGPFPIPYELEGVKYGVPFFLGFQVRKIDQQSGELTIAAWILLNGVRGAVEQTIRSKFNSNNCARYGEDNWVYEFSDVSLTSANAKTLRFQVNGWVETWSCRPNPVPEAVWDDTGCYGEVLGQKYSYGCFVTREGSPIKTPLISPQSFFVMKDFEAVVDSDKRSATLKEYAPTFIGDGIVGSVATVFAFFFNSLPAILSGHFRTDLLKAKLPDDAKPFSFQFDDHAFVEGPAGEGVSPIGQPAIYLGMMATVRLDLKTLNDYMRHRFPTWKDR